MVDDYTPQENMTVLATIIGEDPEDIADVMIVAIDPSGDRIVMQRLVRDTHASDAARPLSQVCDLLVAQSLLASGQQQILHRVHEIYHNERGIPLESYPNP